MSSTNQARASSRPFYYGWVIVAVMCTAGTLSMTLGTLNFGLFIKPMGDRLGIGRATFGWAQTGRMVVGAAGSPIIGRLVDRFGSRYLLPLGAFVTGSALIGVSRVDHSWQLVALFSLMGIIAIGGPANLTTTVPIAKWFVSKRSRAMSLVVLGPFLGGVVFIPLTQLLIDSLGWRNAWVVLAATGAGLIIPLSLIFVRRQPEDMGLLPDGAAVPVSAIQSPGRDPTPSDAGEVSWTLGETIRSATYWRLAFVFSIVMVSVSTGGLHRIPNFVDQGIDPQLVAFAIALDSVAGGLVTFSMGFVAERVQVRYLGSAAFSLLALATFLNIVGSTPLVMFLAMAIFGMGIGGMMFLQSYVWADYFGRAHLGSIRGVAMPLTLASSGAGAPLAGYIRDSYGSYTYIWAVAIGLLLLAATVIALTPRPVRDRNYMVHEG